MTSTVHECPDFPVLKIVLAYRDARDDAAVLLAFDVLRREGADLTSLPLRDRRANLENLLAANPACLQLIAQTDALEEAEDWLKLVPSIEGVVAKRWDGRYLPGQRDWVKVKRRRTVDCVVIGIAGDQTHPWLVLGLRHADGQLHHLGLARSSKGMLSAQFASVLAEAGPEESPIRSRWQHAAVPTWRRVPPTAVCEVTYTVLDGNRLLRHAARFVRWRPDRSPDDCWLEQLEQSQSIVDRRHHHIRRRQRAPGHSLWPYNRNTERCLAQHVRVIRSVADRDHALGAH